MSTLHKVKAYFGMAPMEDYDDEYYDDDDRGRGYPRRSPGDRFGDDGYGRRYEVAGSTTSREPDEYPPGYRGGYETAYESRLRGTRDFERPSSRFSLRGSTRGALAMDPRRMAMLFERAARCRRSPRCGPRTTARPAPSVSGSARAPRDHGPGHDGQRRRQAAGRLRRRVWRSRCAARSTRSPPRCSCSHRPTSTSPPRSAAASPRPGFTPTSRANWS